MLSYKITDWQQAPGPRVACVRVDRNARDIRGGDLLLDLCDGLDERPTPRMRSALGRVVQALGRDRVDALIERAHLIFRGSGMLVRDGSRRRTLGGIFFRLLKDETLNRRNGPPPSMTTGPGSAPAS
jgi:hypothetical protein